MAALETVFRITRRGQIAALRIDAMMQETHNRSAETTDFEVEDGVTISDHVKLNPLAIDLTCFISDAPANFFGVRALTDISANVVNSLVPGQTDVPNAQSRSPIDAWNYLNTVWEERNLISVITSLQVYRNMILTSLSAPKTPQTGKSLEFKASLKEVRIVSTAVISLPAISLDDPNQAGRNGKGKQTAEGANEEEKKKPSSVLFRTVGKIL